MLTAGLGGVTRHGCVALSESGDLLSVCEQERVTRTKGAGFAATGLPDEALDVSLGRLRRHRTEVERYIVAENGFNDPLPVAVDRIGHHFAHACTAHLTSPFTRSVVLVCDHEAPKVSVWKADGASIVEVPFNWEGPGLADLYSAIAAAIGFGSSAGDQRLEALARLRPEARDLRVDGLFTFAGSRLDVHARWREVVSELLNDAAIASDGLLGRAAVAAALQTRVVDLFLELLAAVYRQTGGESVCLAGSLFYHSSIITAARLRGPYAAVFTPIDPGNAGLSVGASLHGAGAGPQAVSPFLGPVYTPEEIKETLDNCKLRYDWEPEGRIVELTVRELLRGGLVGWFDGAMEWGPRALGCRSILANPFAPFVLENLNRFLKRRESWRGYALSGLQDTVTKEFDGPGHAHFMECDYKPRDRDRFRSVLPTPDASLRVQTVGALAPPRFSRLLEAFGTESGVPVLVNTSFNGFHEPIVCSPRDAVRVFYGSGLDLLVLGQFVLSK
jgi:carbamoyltransferase